HRASLASLACAEPGHCGTAARCADGDARRYALASLAVTTAAAAAALSPLLATAARNGSDASSTRRLSSSAVTVAVRAVEWRRAISPNESPGPSSLIAASSMTV